MAVSSLVLIRPRAPATRVKTPALKSMPPIPTQRGSPTTSGGPRAELRILDAVVDVAGRNGYARLTVEAVLAAARVSRATFYQYFANVEECFGCAYRRYAEQLTTDVAERVRRQANPHLVILDALVDLAISRPEVARVLMAEGLAAGSVGMQDRDAVITKLEHAMTGSAAHDSRIDLPPGTLIGGIFRFLSMRLLDGGALDGPREDVREWVLAFARRSSQPSWSSTFMPALPSEVSRACALPRHPRPAGTSRERIMKATAASVREKGYRDITVADIVGAAGVSRRGFYNEFSSKAHAFMAAYEYGFERTVAACAPAFFTPAVWPERVWRGAHAFTGFLSREPLLAYLGFVECYALGPGFAARVHDMQLAFTLLLEEGYRQRPQGRRLSRACSHLAAATIFEAGFQASRRSASIFLRRLQPLAVYIALAPFIGLEEAGEFVAAKLSAT
jgi:AcrR family transcriptional regulator